MGRAGGGAEALFLTLFMGLPSSVQNLSSQVLQPRESGYLTLFPPDSMEKFPQGLAPLSRVSGFLLLMLSRGHPKKRDPRP